MIFKGRKKYLRNHNRPLKKCFWYKNLDDKEELEAVVGDSREEVEDEIDFERVTLVAPDMCTEFAKIQF